MASLRERCEDSFEKFTVVSLAIVAYKYDLPTYRVYIDHAQLDKTGKFQAVFVNYETKDRYVAIWESNYDMPLVSRLEVCGT